MSDWVKDAERARLQRLKREGEADATIAATIAELLVLFEDHYWDSLATHKELLLQHIRFVLHIYRKRQENRSESVPTPPEVKEGCE